MIKFFKRNIFRRRKPSADIIKSDKIKLSLIPVERKNEL